jgi:hypothetical protein
VSARLLPQLGEATCGHLDSRWQRVGHWAAGVCRETGVPVCPKQVVADSLDEAYQGASHLGPPRLLLELPPPVNPPGVISFGAFTPWWSFRVRFIVSDGKALSIVEFAVVEEGVGAWTVDEMFQARGGRVDVPFRVEAAEDVWIRARSPRSFSVRPAQVGRLTIEVRDHTQPQGEFHAVVLSEGIQVG